MDNIVVNLLLIIIGFILLIKGADFLVNGASSLAKRLKISDIAIGLTVVAMGTSAPELVVNIISGSADSDGLVFGNIIGSNIFNLFLILGVSALINPIKVDNNALLKEIPFSLFIAILVFILVNDTMLFESDSNILSRWDGLLLTILFLGFLLYIFLNLKQEIKDDSDEIIILSKKKTTIFIIFGMIGLVIGGHLIVKNAISVANYLNVSDKIIGLTLLASGTSLPELATTAAAALKKKSDLAIGNIIGSNIFNLLLVLGSTALIHSPLYFDTVLNVDLLFVIIGTLLLYFYMFTFIKFKIDRIEGFLYLLGFIGYMIFLFYRIP